MNHTGLTAIFFGYLQKNKYAGMTNFFLFCQDTKRAENNSTEADKEIQNEAERSKMEIDVTENTSGEISQQESKEKVSMVDLISSGDALTQDVKTEEEMFQSVSAKKKW